MEIKNFSKHTGDIWPQSNPLIDHWPQRSPPPPSAVGLRGKQASWCWSGHVPEVRTAWWVTCTRLEHRSQRERKRLTEGFVFVFRSLAAGLVTLNPSPGSLRAQLQSVSDDMRLMGAASHLDLSDVRSEVKHDDSGVYFSQTKSLHRLPFNIWGINNVQIIIIIIILPHLDLTYRDRFIWNLTHLDDPLNLFYVFHQLILWLIRNSI